MKLYSLCFLVLLASKVSAVPFALAPEHSEPSENSGFLEIEDMASQTIKRSDDAVFPFVYECPSFKVSGKTCGCNYITGCYQGRDNACWNVNQSSAGCKIVSIGCDTTKTCFMASGSGWCRFANSGSTTAPKTDCNNPADCINPSIKGFVCNGQGNYKWPNGSYKIMPSPN